MASVRGKFNWLILATLLQLTVPISDCGADEKVDCFYSCIEGDPQASVDYYMARDGNYYPIPSPPPVTVRGPAVYYDHGYPVRVGSEPPAYCEPYYHETRRERWRRELNDWHDEQVRKYHK